MNGANRYRLWLIGGALTAVALLAVGWLVLIGPQYSQTARLQDQDNTAQMQLTTLRHKLADLRRQNGNLAQYEADLAQDRAALPSTAALSDFLRELQSAGDAAGVTITPATFGAPTAMKQAPQMYTIGVNLTAQGKLAQTQRFLTELQQVQPRAVLVNNASVSTTGTTLTGPVTLSVVMQVFVSTAAASAQPSASATAGTSSK